jgi:hypothetical protein
MTMMEDVGTVPKTISFCVITTFLIAVVTIMSYFGRVISFYCSFLVVIGYLTSTLIAIAMKNGPLITMVATWCIFAIPVIDVLLFLNYKILVSFFSKIWNLLS